MPPDQEPSKENALDILLARAPSPEAPAWFEARLKARLRREEGRRLFGLRLWQRSFLLGWGLPAGAALIAAMLFLKNPEKTKDFSPAEVSQNATDVELAKALDAFASYIQDEPGYVSDTDEWLPF